MMMKKKVNLLSDLIKLVHGRIDTIDRVNNGCILSRLIIKYLKFDANLLDCNTVAVRKPWNFVHCHDYYLFKNSIEHETNHYQFTLIPCKKDFT